MRSRVMRKWRDKKGSSFRVVVQDKMTMRAYSRGEPRFHVEHLTFDAMGQECWRPFAVVGWCNDADDWLYYFLKDLCDTPSAVHHSDQYFEVRSDDDT